MRRVIPADMDEIDSWHEERGMFPLNKGVYPLLGLIEPEIAAGFLYRTDTKIAIFENFVSNPKADKVRRREAMLEIAKELEAQAQILGFKYFTAVTKHKSIEDLSLKHGMKFLGTFQIYGKEI